MIAVSMLSSRPMIPMSYLSTIFSDRRIRALVMVGVQSLSIVCHTSVVPSCCAESASESLDSQMTRTEPFSGDGRFEWFNWTES